MRSRIWIVAGLWMVCALLITVALGLGRQVGREALAFASLQDANIDIFVADVSTGMIHRLTAARAFETLPAWSDQTGRVAYVWSEDAERTLTIRDMTLGSSSRLENYSMAV